MASRVTPDQPKGPWLGIDGRLWRHTIGRFSNLCRIAIYAGASLAQMGKIIVKIVIHGLTVQKQDENQNHEGAWSLRGIAIDSIGLTLMVEGVWKCAERMFLSPSIKDPDFDKSMDALSSFLCGEIHDSKDRSAKEVAELADACVWKVLSTSRNPDDWSGKNYLPNDNNRRMELPGDNLPKDRDYNAVQKRYLPEDTAIKTTSDN